MRLLFPFNYCCLFLYLCICDQQSLLTENRFLSPSFPSSSSLMSCTRNSCFPRNTSDKRSSQDVSRKKRNKTRSYIYRHHCPENLRQTTRRKREEKKYLMATGMKGTGKKEKREKRLKKVTSSSRKNRLPVSCCNSSKNNKNILQVKLERQPVLSVQHRKSEWQVKDDDSE